MDHVIQLEDLGQAMEDVLKQAVQNTMELLPAFIEDVVKPKVVSFCPSAEEEGNLISKDTAGIGSTEFGRFLRNGANQLPIQTAIMAESPYKSGEGWCFGDSTRINSKTAFSWMRHSRGKDGRWVAELISEPSAPFDFGYSQALEMGGTWSVVPRPGRKYLYPERGVRKTQMTKTLEPRQMFFRSVSDFSVQAELIARIKRSFTNA